MTYKVDSEHIVVSDGADTFVIEKGRIVLAQRGGEGGKSGEYRWRREAL